MKFNEILFTEIYSPFNIVHTWNIRISAPLRTITRILTSLRPIWALPTTGLTPRSRPRFRPSPAIPRPPLPLRSTHYSILLFLPTTIVLSTRSGWSRLIRFFKPKSALLLSLSTFPFSSQRDMDFIVARQNRFIQKFAQTPSAPWSAIIFLFFRPRRLRNG